MVKKKFRAFWCIICLGSWIRSYTYHQKILTGSHGRTVTSSVVYPLSLIFLMRGKSWIWVSQNKHVRNSHASSVTICEIFETMHRRVLVKTFNQTLRYVVTNIGITNNLICQHISRTLESWLRWPMGSKQFGNRVLTWQIMFLCHLFVLSTLASKFSSELQHS